MKPIYWILLAGLFVLLLSMERIQKEKTGARIAALMEEIEFKEAKNQYLRYKVNIFKSPQAVIESATAEGLEVAKPSQVIILKDNYDVAKRKN